jgi:hypothetical protein
MRLTNLVISTSRTEMQKALAEQFEKAHVKAHTRKTKSGKLTQVKEHEDARQKRLNFWKSKHQRHKEMVQHHNALEKKHDKLSNAYWKKYSTSADSKTGDSHRRKSKKHDIQARKHNSLSIHHWNKMANAKDQMRMYERNAMSEGRAVSMLKKLAARNERYSKHTEDTSFASMYRGDAKEIRKIASYVRAKKYDNAARVVNNLDSEVIDSLPKKVMAFLEQRTEKLKYSWRY